MRLVKFKCTDYKSIRSIEPCWLAQDLTTFAGKNESGKTTALEAMSDFDKNVDSIREEAVPLEDSDLRPCLVFWFTPSKEVWDEMFASIGIQPNKNCERY
ncbi:ATP-binding protein [Porticoccaceae bacterium]|nr:ATP-binding protein [Porticoccaceae bacterium]